MIKAFGKRNTVIGVALLSLIGLLSACGGGGSSGGGTSASDKTPSLALFAGNMGGAGNNDGTGAVARFSYPSGVATDSAGNVYVADSNNNTIRKITSGGVVTTLAGIAGVAGMDDTANNPPATFDFPTGVAVDSHGNVYVADSNNNMIRKIDSAGAVSTFAGTGVAGSDDTAINVQPTFYFPTGVAIDSNDNVYVADSGNNTIRMITPAGVVSTFAGSAGVSGSADSTDGTGATARFSYPSGVAIDSVGNVFVADFNNSTIRKIDLATGAVITFAGIAGTAGSDDTDTGITATFDGPTGITLDTAGNVYVADSYNDNIRMITPAGVVTTLAGPVGTDAAGVSGSANGTGAAAGFYTPSGVAFDSNTGNVYVADSDNNTIRKVTPGGVVSTLAGKATVTGSADGTVVTATFNNPSGITFDSAGNIYVADHDNSTIRKISTVGVVTTPFGTAGITGSTDTAGGTPSLNYPSGVATDSNGNIYVADSSNNTIRKITPAGVVSTFAGSAGASGNIDSTDGTGATARFSYPSGVATDTAGNVYVADYNNNAIRKITPSGNVTTLASGLSNPASVAVDSAGNVYVADSGSNTIRKITSGGMSIFAGTGNPGSDDATVGTDASFNNPTGVTIDSNGNVYVADRDNHTIRKITPAGVVSTVVGVAGQAGFIPGDLPGLMNYPEGVAINGTSLYIVTGGGIAVVKYVP